MWTNKGVKQIFDTYGERVNSISLNNGKYFFIGYQSGPQLEDITFDNIEGCDVMRVQHTSISHGYPIKFETLLTTEFIEGIDILSEEDKDKRLDPLAMK